MAISFTLLLNTTLIMFSFVGLHKLMNVTLASAFEHNTFSGIAKITRNFLVYLGFKTYIIFGIIYLPWYMPFFYIICVLVILVTLMRLLTLADLVTIHTFAPTSPSRQFFYSMLAVSNLVYAIYTMVSY